MKDNKDILSEAIKDLKNAHVPPGPPQEVRDVTLAKLKRATEQSQEANISILERLRTTKSFIRFATKLAAAAILLVLVGYTAGRLSAPDVEKLQATLETSLRSSIEPAIREELLEQVKDYLQLGLTAGYVQLKEQLTAEYRRDLNEYAVRTLAASGAMTNQRLEELIQAINAAQLQDRRWVTAALQQIELNRLRDKSQLSSGLETLAVRTADELTRTKEDIVQLLVYTQPAGPVPNVYEGSETINEENERSRK